MRRKQQQSFIMFTRFPKSKGEHLIYFECTLYSLFRLVWEKKKQTAI